jgi:hypothetical protein
MTFERVRKMALALDGVEEGLSYRTPAFRVHGQLLARLRDDLGALVVRTTFDERDEHLREDPDVFFLVDHYLKYQWVLVRLSAVSVPVMRETLQRAYELAAS